MCIQSSGILVLRKLDIKNNNMDKNTITCEDISNIKPINIATVHKICSGQVVLSLAIAVKELVENSLDAGATHIEIKFKNHGIDLIEVTDNGSGVTDDNFEALTLKYHTSKLSEYSDLLGVSSFGFRGEALSSLCALANLTVTTRHKNAKYATKIEYDHKGNITKKTPCSRQIGTTVSLTNLFYSLPVRQKEFHKNAKREFNKMTQLLYAYCLISLGVRITCSNQTSLNSKSLVVATQGSTSYKDNISCVFGVKQLQTILEVKPQYVSNIKENIFKGLTGDVEDTEESIYIEDVQIDLSDDSNDADNPDPKNETTSSVMQKSQGYKNVVAPVEFTGFVSSCAHGAGRSSTDRQFFYVNNRPCEPTKVIKLVNEIYRQYNPSQYPFVFLNVNMERTCVDVNVTPDKRKIFLTKEKIILDVLKHSLLKLFESIPRTLKIETPLCSQETNKTVEAELDQPRIFNTFLQQFGKYKTNLESRPNEKDNKQELKRRSTSMLDFISAKTAKKASDESNVDIKNDEKCFEDGKSNDAEDSDYIGIIETNSVFDRESSKVTNLCADKTPIKLEKDIDMKSEISKSKNDQNREVLYLDSTDNMPDTQIRDISEVLVQKSRSIDYKNKIITPKLNLSTETTEKATQQQRVKVMTDQKDLGKNNRKTVIMKTSFEHVKALTEIYLKKERKTLPSIFKFKSEINPVFNKKCEEELSREISKDSFKEMKIVGQFNLGFIITKLGNDLFIIDQHATDEIYNFETLQKTTELTSQKLVIPQQLELTGVNEQILMENLDVFKKNGFTFEINEAALPTKRVKLLTLPMSKNWIFGKDDIEELLFILRESPSEYCRPSRVRAMFASRACRKSVMIGTALSKADMQKLVHHMAEIDQPWNCPHGRPTIRHLVNLTMVHTKDNCD